MSSLIEVFVSMKKRSILWDWWGLCDTIVQSSTRFLKRDHSRRCTIDRHLRTTRLRWDVEASYRKGHYRLCHSSRIRTKITQMTCLSFPTSLTIHWGLHGWTRNAIVELYHRVTLVGSWRKARPTWRFTRILISSWQRAILYRLYPLRLNLG